MVQALNAALLHYDADIRKRNAKGQKPNGYVQENALPLRTSRASCYNNLGMYIPSILPGPQFSVAVYHYIVMKWIYIRISKQEFY